ncbi:MAG: co-chaperone DjlA [Legionellaceae bacterium]|nr:co-chaperone DjlA [Legionellaceae bacterium]
MNLRNFFSGKNWWGKLTGAFFGFLMAGPVGAIIGIIIGNFFDRGLSQHFSRPHWYYHAEQRKNVQRAFFQTTFLVLGYIAKVDGRVSQQEIQMAKGLMDEMRLNSAQKSEAKRLFNKGKETSFNLGRALTMLKENCHDNPDLLRLFLDIQYRAAQIDGLSQAKIDALNTIFQRMGFAPLYRQYQFYEDFTQQYQKQRNEQQQSQYQQDYQRSHHHSSYQQASRHTSLAQAFAILEIPETASKAEVKRAYRRLMSRNHPDKLIAQGLPEEMIKMATHKTQTISKAYDQICASKGW